MTKKFSDLTEEDLDSFPNNVMTKLLQEELKGLTRGPIGIPVEPAGYSLKQQGYIRTLEMALVSLYDRSSSVPESWVIDYHYLIEKIRSKS